jgi:hypothetical protein
MPVTSFSPLGRALSLSTPEIHPGAGHDGQTGRLLSTDVTTGMMKFM